MPTSTSSGLNNGSPEITELDIFVECFRCKFRGALVGLADHVEPHKRVPEVVLEKSMMNVMIGRRAEPNQMKDAVPRKGVLTVDQNQPVGISTSKCHVRPDVAMYKVRRSVKWYQNHADGIKH